MPRSVVAMVDRSPRAVIVGITATVIVIVSLIARMTCSFKEAQPHERSAEHGGRPRVRFYR
jgi:hypothetical protein